MTTPMTTLAGIIGIPGRFGSESLDGFDRNACPPSSESAGSEILGRAELVVLEFSPLLIERLGGDVAWVADFLARFDQLKIVRGDSLETPVQGTPAEIGAMREPG